MDLPEPWLPFLFPITNLPSEFRTNTPTPTLGFMIIWSVVLLGLRRCLGLTCKGEWAGKQRGSTALERRGGSLIGGGLWRSLV